ncbi:MAG: DUF2442 domain-containing protein [Candidatus Riflebacteria bacterium]|nr:DUF2442 domain-containing protein [Candidatus Riflebacteria bacterium]
MWLGWLEEFPDYKTQGESLEELEGNLRDIYADLIGKAIPDKRTGSKKIAKLTPHKDWTLSVTTSDGRTGQIDIRPYLQYEAFEELKDITEFMKIKNGGYFVEWECGADLSVDTIEAKMVTFNER